MALIRDESPFVHLPATLDPRQRLFLDAIRYSISMLDVAHSRIWATLLKISVEETTSKSDDQAGSIQEFPKIFLDAFSIVDMTHRLWALLDQMPKLKRTPDLRVFLAKLRSAEEIRNAVQHLRGELDSLANTDDPTWGWLLWTYVPDYSGNFHTFFALPGSLGRTKVSPETGGPEGIFRLPLDQIELSAYGHRLSLSDIYRAVEAFVPNFETILKNAFTEAPEGVTDILVRLEGHTERPPEISKLITPLE